MVKMLFQNKNAWLRIVESFTTILLIATVLLLILNKTSLSESEKAEQISDRAYAILREVQLNNTLRASVVNVDVTGKIIWGNFNETNGLSLLKEMITDRVPKQLICEAQLCELSDECVLETNVDGSIFTRSALLSATNEMYNPKRLKLFCWEIT